MNTLKQAASRKRKYTPSRKENFPIGRKKGFLLLANERIHERGRCAREILMIGFRQCFGPQKRRRLLVPWRSESRRFSRLSWKQDVCPILARRRKKGFWLRFRNGFPCELLKCPEFHEFSIFPHKSLDVLIGK